MTKTITIIKNICHCVKGKKMNNEKMDLAPIKRQVSAVVSSAGSLEINNKPDLIKATDVLTKIKSIANEIKEKKDSIIKPLNEALKNARDLFRPLETDYSEAETTVKMKMVIFNQQEEKKAAEATAKIEQKVEAGKMSMEVAADKIEEVIPENKVEGKSGSIQFRVVKKVVIENEFDVPREFLMLDMVKIRKAALNGFIIKGVKVVEEKVVASGRN